MSKEIKDAHQLGGEHTHIIAIQPVGRELPRLIALHVRVDGVIMLYEMKKNKNRHGYEYNFLRQEQDESGNLTKLVNTLLGKEVYDAVEQFV